MERQMSLVTAMLSRLNHQQSQLLTALSLLPTHTPTKSLNNTNVSDSQEQGFHTYSLRISNA